MTTHQLNALSRTFLPVSAQVTVEGGRVTEARCQALLFRGFEMMLQGRDPRDAAYFTQRICGICSTAHATAATLALEEMAPVEVPPNAVLLRNLIFGADLLQNHLRHFYLFSLLDYVKGPQEPPFYPYAGDDFRLGEADNRRMLEHYWEAVTLSAKAHQMAALFGGKMPHQHGILPGGATVAPDVQRVVSFRSLLREIKSFVEDKYLPDVETLAAAYPEYSQLGGGPVNFLSYGMFPRPEGGRYWPSGVLREGKREELDPGAIGTETAFAWYEREDKPKSPQEVPPRPQREREEAYTWIKATRYDGMPLETGPLARLWLRGAYRRGISVMDRHWARALEAKEVTVLMEQWLERLYPQEKVLTPYDLPREGEGMGLTDAMRGALGHWVKISGGRISHYQVIVPSDWNFSPRDSQGRRGPVEEALIGTPVADPSNLLEVGRVIRSYDPCFACAVHILRPDGSMGEFIV